MTAKTRVVPGATPHLQTRKARHESHTVEAPAAAVNKKQPRWVRLDRPGAVRPHYAEFAQRKLLWPDIHLLFLLQLLHQFLEVVTVGQRHQGLGRP